MLNLKSQMLNYLSTNKGSAMVLALTVSILLFILMVSGVLLIRQQTKLISGSRGKSAALSVAEAGLDSGIWRLERNQSLTFDGSNNYNFTGSNTQGTFSVQIHKDNETKFEITSTGTKANSNEKRAVKEDVYYINLSRSVATFSSANGGGQVQGNVNIWGPFYTSDDLTLSGNVDAQNLTGTTGNPFMVRGNLYNNSNGVDIGTDASPMAVFIKETISRPGQVYDLVSTNVPEVSLPEIVRTQYLNAAEANDNAISGGDVTLNTSVVQFGQRGNGTYTFDYNPSTSTVNLEGVIYINGNLALNRSINYVHPSGFKQATIFVNGTVTINGQLLAPSGNDPATGKPYYPGSSVLALVNEDQTATNDITVTFPSGSQPTVQSFFYTSGRLYVAKKVTIEGTIMANVLWLENVPDLKAPSEAVMNNYPVLYPAKDLAILTTANWREVAP